jgi:hypothetical protein
MLSTVETKPYKAYIAGVGATLTALAGAWAGVEVAASDDVVTAAETGSLVTVIITAVATIYGVWARRNPPVDK